MGEGILDTGMANGSLLLELENRQVTPNSIRETGHALPPIQMVLALLTTGLDDQREGIYYYG